MPWPLDSGGHLRTYHLLRMLAVRFDVRLVVPERGNGEDGRPALERAGIRVRPVAVPPRTALSAAFGMVAAAARREPYVLFARHRQGRVKHALRLEVSRERPSVLYLDHLDSLVYAGVAAGVPLVVDMHNVYSRLAARTAAGMTGSVKRRYLASQAGLIERKERSAAHAAHTLITVSDDEARHFSSIGAARVAVVPNGVDCAAFDQLPVDRSGPPTILYVGSLEWPPNVSAACYLARQVLPSVRRRLPEARLALVGKNPTAEVASLAHADDHVEVNGNVIDVRPYFRKAHVLAVPLEAGGGTRLKILEAFAAGLPVVSTAIGCEGIGAVHQEHLIVTDRETCGDAVAQVLLDPSHAADRAQRASSLARRDYDWSVVGRLAADAVAYAASDRRPTPAVLAELAVRTGVPTRW